MKMDARPPALGADALAVEVGRHRVCRDLDFTLQPGHTLVILGRNGAGKSTLLHTLAGLRPPAAGSATARPSGRTIPNSGYRPSSPTAFANCSFSMVSGSTIWRCSAAVPRFPRRSARC